MTADNRRKEAQCKAKAGEMGESPKLLPNGVMAVETGKNNSFLPSSQHDDPQVTVEDVVSDDNMREALKAVKSNKGAPGVDGVTVEEIDKMMRQYWPAIKQAILEGKYIPQPVRRAEISKPDGGVRALGIPTVMDRIIQVAIYKKLMPIFDPTFSESSYGFRPNRNAHQAVLQAQKYIHDGYDWVVDIDLEKFFDKVNHDILMARVARRVKDKKILLLIRRFLQAGVMDGGLVSSTKEGTPQGGPLSPLLSNILLDDLDRALERRGLRFVRYADDCNTYVKSERAGKRVMEVTTKYLSSQLKLKVNQQKSGVGRPWDLKFLGFTLTADTKQLAIHASPIKRFKDKIRSLTKTLRGMNIKDGIRKCIMPVTRGWVNYFGIVPEVRVFETLDGWIRRKIRDCLWRQWKRPKARCRKLVSRGVNPETAKRAANSGKGPWRMACIYAVHRALGNAVIEELGYLPMAKIAYATRVKDS